MVKLKEKYSARDQRSLERIKEVYAFKNRQAPYVIYDAPYWLFGEQEAAIPNGYCGENPEIMMKFQLDNIITHYESNDYPDDCYCGFLMPWFGTGVLASGFGIGVEIPEKMDPAVQMSTIKDPKELEALKIPDPYKGGLMPRVLKQIDYFKANCDLPIGVTDCQGPLTTALSIIGYENYCYWVYDHPDVVHKLMQLCTDALIEWVKIQKKHIGNSDPAYVLGMRLPEGNGVWMSDDDSVIMNEGLFGEFVKPYNEQLLQAFGGGCIHWCGSSNQNLKHYMNTKGLVGIHNMNLDNFDAAKIVRKACLDNGIVYYWADFTPGNERLESYFDTVFKEIPQEGMIVASYIAPAITLNVGKYESKARDKTALSKLTTQIIQSKKKLYFQKAG
jgi:hypothetical protein